MKTYQRASQSFPGLKAETEFNRKYNSASAVLKRIAFNFSVVFALPALALLISPYSKATASAFCYIWFGVIVFGMLVCRPPANYNSYSDWFADRKNWFQKY
jgi:hypothetical protein